MREQTQEYQKLNAFSRRPCATQIVSYAVIMAVNLIFWLLIQNRFISQGRRFAMILLFSMSLVVLLVVGFITSYLDPSDPVLKQQFNSKKPINFGHNLDRYLYCQHCHSYVFVTSRHCKQCDRCITKFDHHCIWINSCIGEINYKSFIVMIWAAFIHLFLFLVSLALLWSENNWQMYMTEIIVSWIVGFIVLIFVVMLIGLISLHSFLMCNNMTTFDYILSKKTHEDRRKFNNVIRVKMQDLKEKEPECPAEKQRQNINNENFKTQNEIPLPSAFQQVKQDLQQQRSDFPSLQCFNQVKKQSNSIEMRAVAPQNFESVLFEKIQEKNNLVILYRSNRSLKVLVGNSIEIKERRGSVNELSAKSNKSSEVYDNRKKVERKVHSQVI